MFIAALALGTDEFVIAGVLNTVAADLHVTAGAAGQLVTSFALAFALGAPALAVWVDRRPRRVVLLAGLGVFVLTNIGCALAHDMTSLMIVRVLAGLSAAVVSTTAFATAAEGAPEGRQGRYLAVVTTGLTVALFTGVPVGTWLAEVLSWRTTFVLIAAVAASSALIAAATMPRLPGSAPSTLAERFAPLRNPGVLRMVVAVLACGTGGLMFYTYLGPITLHTLGTDAPLPFLLLVVGVVGLGSALLGGRLTDLHGARWARLMILGGHVLALAALTVIVQVTAPVWWFGPGLAVWAVFAWALNPPLQASTIAAAPEAAMTAVSLNVSGLYLGAAAGGALGGFLLDRSSAPVLPAVGVIALGVAWLIAAPRHTNELERSHAAPC
ncbi:MFS transporter [Arachnia propionica]|uniref:MFS transporter n=1 Tax=Arachnia propionica TaxID=1750 RepID=A0A3P1T625_9ACTN|nr:MFS transporter [Arachnia propionica]